MGKLLLIVIVANLKQFTAKSKLIIYTRIFVEFYKWINYGKVHKIYRMIEFDK